MGDPVECILTPELETSNYIDMQYSALQDMQGETGNLLKLLLKYSCQMLISAVAWNSVFLGIVSLYVPTISTAR